MTDANASEVSLTSKDMGISELTLTGQRLPHSSKNYCRCFKEIIDI